MKNIFWVVVFVVLGVAIMYAGTWYSNKISMDSQQAVQQQATTAAQNQQDLMKNLKITDTKVGTGTEAQPGDTVSVLYTGKFDGGTVFDASSLHGNTPFSFQLGAGNVIQGWDLGVVGMKVGGTRELTIPPELAYGPNDYQSIPGGSTLHFTVQLLSVSSTGQ